MDLRQGWPGIGAVGILSKFCFIFGWMSIEVQPCSKPWQLCTILFAYLMNTPRHFENKNLKERSTYLLWLLIAVSGLIGFRFLRPIIQPNRNSGASVEWILTFSIIILLTVYFLLHKRFVSITFDRSADKIILTTTTLLSGTKINNYDYIDISYKNGKDAGSFRKRGTRFIEIYNKKQKLIKLERTTIGEYPFDNILTELEQLKNSS